MSTQPSWRDRSEALVMAMKDVAPAGHPHPDMPGTPQHQALFMHYVDALGNAKHESDSWWNNLVDVESSRAASHQEAVTAVRTRHPGGPVTYGTVTYVLRRFWFECMALNQQSAGDVGRVAPEEFLMRWLIRSQQQELARFLSALPFWPIGQDEQGQWI